MKYNIGYLLMLLISYQLVGQEIKGIVKDVNGAPLNEASIFVTKTGTNTTTDAKGQFLIKALVGDELQISLINYDKIIIAASDDMTLVMQENNQKVLDEVVIVGYGTKKKGAVTGAVVQLKSDEILKNPAQSAIQAVQGKAAGVNIVTNDEPGANPSIIIRGLGSLLGSRNPLYVIDGVEANGLNGLSSNDIATIDILKDASSLAIYGQKGANGVVIISTKKGKSGAFKITFDSYYGIKQILKKVNLADSYKFAYYNNTALGSSNYFNFNQPTDTNWLNEITTAGEVTNNAVSVSGGSEKINFYLGLSHYTEKGILSGTNYKRTNLINKNEYKITDDLKITQFVNFSAVSNSPKPLSAFTNAYKQAPIIPVRYANGRYGVPFINTATGLNDIVGNRFNNVANPVAQLENTFEENKNITIFGSLNMEYKIQQNLKFNSSFGATADWSKGYSFMPNRNIWLSQNPSLNENDYAVQLPNDPSNTLYKRRADFYSYNWDNYLTYKKDIGNHTFTTVLGMSRSTNNNTEFLNGQRFNVPEKSNYWSLDFSDSNIKVNPNTVVQNNRSTPIISIAYFGRLEYDFLGKYLFTANIRREGISSFQSAQKWGLFSSASAGWVLSKEKFLENSKLINFLKVRGGYGEVGNGNGPSYNDVTFSRNFYSFGAPSVSLPGIFVANAIDPNLSWETMSEFDLGLDFTMLNNHLTGTFDYYNRKNENIILPVSPPFVLSENPTFINTGTIANTGIEITLRYENKIGSHLTYFIGGNISNNSNKVAAINSPYFRNFVGSGSTNNGEFTKLVKKGEPLGSFYVFKQLGYNSDGEPVLDDMIDGVMGLTDNDRINAGSYIPKITYGSNFGITYKNIDFSVDIYGVGGNKLYNGKKAQRFGGENVEVTVLDNFYTPSNPNAINPKPSNNVPRPSTYFIEDGSFLRINNLTVGYTLTNFTKNFKNIRFYFTATNPFIFTNFSGYSPEIVGNDNANPLGRAGIELDAYPTNKTFLFGVNISL